MRIGDKHYRTIWMDKNTGVISVIDQRKLPFEFEVMELRSLDDACFAIVKQARMYHGSPQRRV